jgi:hypothetical protein
MLLVHAFSLLVVIRTALWLLPFRIVHERVAARAIRVASSNTHPIERIVWSVEAASRRVPRASCLTQAFAAALLLAANGHAAALRVGVAKNDDGSLRAHAWVESDGRTVLGDPRTEAFVALPPLALDR